MFFYACLENLLDSNKLYENIKISPIDTRGNFNNNKMVKTMSIIHYNHNDNDGLIIILQIIITTIETNNGRQ